MLDNLSRWIGQVTKAGIGLLALAIVLQVLFQGVPFLGGDVIGNITSIVGGLGAEGLVGLITAAVIYRLFT